MNREIESPKYVEMECVFDFCTSVSLPKYKLEIYSFITLKTSSFPWKK